MSIKEDIYYKKIIEKIEDGIFIPGNDCSLIKYYFEGKTIHSFKIKARTPEICASLMEYCRCKLSDVPKSSRTKEFYIDTFTDNDVYDYIKNNIDKFDRQFFKDLIATNKYSTAFDRNCFALMPLEYIDEEMCSLAIINSTDWSSNNWFYDVVIRKPEALTNDLWKLGARLYGRVSEGKNKFLNITPDEYKDKEYFKEMCSCNFNSEMEINDDKGKIMDSIPEEFITIEFLLELIEYDINNIVRFNDYALEQIIPKLNLKIWQFIIKSKGYLIKHINLNDERIKYFLSIYDEDSIDYKIGFKDKYEEYLDLKEKAYKKELKNK